MVGGFFMLLPSTHTALSDFYSLAVILEFDCFDDCTDLIEEAMNFDVLC